MISEDKNNTGFVPLATKVTREEARVLNLIAKKKHMTVYELMQLVCSFLVRYTSDRHNMSEEMNRLMILFHSEVGWKDAFNLCNPSAETEVAEEILILQQKGKKGFGAVKIMKPYMGTWLQTENSLDIVERVIEVCIPSAYQRLRDLAQDMGCPRVGEALIMMADDKKTELLDEQNRREMEGAVVTDTNRAIDYGNKSKQLHHRTPDSLAMSKQPTFQFIDDDKELAQYEAEGWEGEIRQRDEAPADC